MPRGAQAVRASSQVGRCPARAHLMAVLEKLPPSQWAAHARWDAASPQPSPPVSLPKFSFCASEVSQLCTPSPRGLPNLPFRPHAQAPLLCLGSPRRSSMAMARALLRGRSMTTGLCTLYSLYQGERLLLSPCQQLQRSALAKVCPELTCWAL